ncbi:phage portal protein [Stagnihabitans tardus]|uniref:Phage portal protein n=1 Tax=Stagnihabitans tardus TaxID=2699202 RepID=A0AAE4Y8F5_9RHOB|nr:phage portal protein [Stagnihabitans tardus]NBZ87901.1 phage portal protein [Stagnihabitans tardus]
MEKQSLFARLFRPSAKSVADPWADLFQLFGVVQTSTGVAISADAAARVPAVGHAIRLISNAAAILPRVVKKVAEDGTETRMAGHWAEALLNRQANDWTSGFDLIRDCMVDALTDDRGGLIYANRSSSGKVVELIRYRSGVMTVDYHQKTGQPFYRMESAPVEAAKVVHLRPIFGKSPLTMFREAIGIAVVLEQHAAALFSKGARPSGVLSFPKGMGQDAVNKAREGWRATHEGADPGGKTAILYDGAEFKPLAFTSTDAQFIENRNFQILEVARAFGVPPSMLYQLDRATWGNTEQMGKEFLVWCLEPWLQALEGAFTRCLLGKGDLVIRFDRDDMTRADLVTRATAISSLTSARVINPNEGRGWLGMAPYAGGEEFANPHINPDRDGAPAKNEAPNGTL